MKTSVVLSFDESGQSPACCPAQASCTITFMTKEASIGQNEVLTWAIGIKQLRQIDGSNEGTIRKTLKKTPSKEETKGPFEGYTRGPVEEGNGPIKEHHWREFEGAKMSRFFQISKKDKFPHLLQCYRTSFMALKTFVYGCLNLCFRVPSIPSI